MMLYVHDISRKSRGKLQTGCVVRTTIQLDKVMNCNSWITFEGTGADAKEAVTELHEGMLEALVNLEKAVHDIADGQYTLLKEEPIGSPDKLPALPKGRSIDRMNSVIVTESGSAICIPAAKPREGIIDAALKEVL